MSIKPINQSGQAAIMFAIFIAMVLCLLSVGFAALAQNDQRQTLDKTLSYQASYAAESAINKIQSLYQQNPYSLSPNSDCTGDPTGNTVSQYIKDLDNATPNSNINITCLTWNSTPASLQFSSVSNSPVTTPIIPNPSSSKIIINWAPSSGTGNAYGIENSLILSSGFIPTLRLTVAEMTNVSDIGVLYLNPSNSNQAMTSTIGNSTNSGSIANASCQEDSCTITLNIALGTDTSWSNKLLSISSLNGDSNIAISEPSTTFSGSQAVIDATAQSQDVIKRIIAYIPLGKTTWQPDFSASANTLCKNFEYDNNANNSNNQKAGPVSNTTCPLD